MSSGPPTNSSRASSSDIASARLPADAGCWPPPGAAVPGAPRRPRRPRLLETVQAARAAMDLEACPYGNAMPELHELSALDLAAAYRRGDTHPREVVDHLLGPRRRAFRHRRRLRHRDPRRGPGRCRPGRRAAARAPRGGARCCSACRPRSRTSTRRRACAPPSGRRSLRDTVPTVSDEVVLRMEAAGMVSLGKTNTPEFGAPCYTEPEVAPPARTPYDLDRSAGGSSGGAAAAVAAGLLPVAQGSDGGGSIRIPASVCGLVGVQTHPRAGSAAAPVYGDITGLGVAGPLATTVRDAAAMLDAMAGPAVGDPTWAPPLPADETLPRLVRPGPAADCASPASPTPPISDQPVEPDVLDGYERAEPTARRARARGRRHRLHGARAHLARLRGGVVGQQRLLAARPRRRGASCARSPSGCARAVRCHAGPRVRRRAGRHAAGGRPDPAARWRRTTPCSPRPSRQLPAPVGGLRDDADPARDFDNQKRFTPFTAIWNVTGMPAVSLPLHWTDRHGPACRSA